MLKRLFFFSFFIIAALTIVSCDDEPIIGKGLLPGEDKIYLDTDSTFTLKAYTEKIDSFKINDISYGIIGNYTDFLFGTFQSGVVLEYLHNEGYFYFPESCVYDNVVLTFAYKSESYHIKPYGDVDVEQEIEIYQMSEIPYEYIYDYNIEGQYIDEKLGSIKFVPYNDSVAFPTASVTSLQYLPSFTDNEELIDIIGDYTDTKYKNIEVFIDSIEGQHGDFLTFDQKEDIGKYIEYLHDVTLDREFLKDPSGNGFIFGDSATNTTIMDLMPGLYLKTKTAENAALLLVNINNNFSKLRLNYNYDDTSTSYVNLYSYNGLNIFSRKFSENAPFFDQLDNDEPEEIGNVFVQGMGSLQTIIELPDLSAFKDMNIVKADIELNVDFEMQDTLNYRLPDNFELYYLNEDDELMPIQDYSSTSGYGYEYVTDGKLKFVISTLIQNLLLEKIEVKSLVLRTPYLNSRYERAVFKRASDDTFVKLTLKFTNYSGEGINN